MGNVGTLELHSNELTQFLMLLNPLQYKILSEPQ